MIFLIVMKKEDKNRKEASLRVRKQGNCVRNSNNSHNVVGCFALFVAMFLLSSCASNKVAMPLPWQERKVVVDGATTDWETPLKFHTKDAKVQYGLANDSENLYFCLMASDDQTQMKLLLNGLEFTIDTLGGKKKHVSIHFPLTEANGPASRPVGMGEMPDIPKMRSKLLGGAKEIDTEGFNVATGNGRIPIENLTGIEVRIDWDIYNILVYELKIPLSTFLPIKQVNKQFGISWSIKGMPQPQMPSGMPSGGMPSGGMSGGMRPPAGGMPPGGMPGGMDRSLFEMVNANLKVNLAAK